MPRFHLAKRDEFGNVYSNMQMVVEAAGVMDACLVFYREWSEFPSEAQWLPEGTLEWRGGGEGGAEKIKNLEYSLTAAADKIERQAHNIRGLERKVSRLKTRVTVLRSLYAKARNYLDKVVINSKIVGEGLDKEYANSQLQEDEEETVWEDRKAWEDEEDEGEEV